MSCTSWKTKASVRMGSCLALALTLSGASAFAQVGGAGGASGAGGAGGTTSSVPSCADATMFPNPIILTGSSAFEPTSSYFAVKAAALATPVTIIYNPTGSCAGVTAISTHQALTKTGNVYKTMDSAGRPVKATCQLDTTPMYGDIGISDVFYESCGNGAKPATLGDYQGPVQAMLPIVASTNTAIQAISAEQAAAIWGCGMAGKVGMFTDDSPTSYGIQQRDSNSGSQMLFAANIGVPGNMLKGRMNASGGALLTSMTMGAATEPMQVIGFIAADAYKGALSAASPTPIHALAFRGFGQTKAYYADSTATAVDRRNVRDGHYVIAAPEHMFAPLTAGVPSANAQKFIDWINGTAMIDTSPYTWIDLEAVAGTIPQCAMKVTHTADGGVMKPYAPPKPCGCYFESKATGLPAPAGCTVCSATVPCAGGKTCSYGYCE